MYRSTKGASKARRDQINAEIRNLKDLLPISDADKARLSYLHIMSLACMYTRKSVFFSQGRYDPDVMFDSFLSSLSVLYVKTELHSVREYRTREVAVRGADIHKSVIAVYCLWTSDCFTFVIVYVRVYFYEPYYHFYIPIYFPYFRDCLTLTYCLLLSRFKCSRVPGC